MGIIFKNTGMVKEALESFNNALEFWYKIGNIEREAKLLEAIGDIELSVGNVEKAYLYKDALDIYEELKAKEKIKRLKEKINFLKAE